MTTTPRRRTRRQRVAVLGAPPAAVLVGDTATAASVAQRTGTIAYVHSVGTGPGTRASLFVIHVDGQNKVQLTNSPDTDVAPSWAPHS